MDYVKMNLRNIGVRNGVQEVWTKQNGHLSWSKPKPKLKRWSAKNE